MKLVFSEAQPDYDHYQFPYAVWAFPEPGETPADLFEAGFLPSSRFLDRFYLCRQIRINLARFTPSSENRRILKKCSHISATLVPRRQYQYTPERREFFKVYADIKFGKDVMTYERLDGLFEAPIISHLLTFHDPATSQEIGTVTLFLQEPRLAYYYYAFYDLNYYKQNLGIYMMTWAVKYFADTGFKYIYLGTCYSKNALYKTQFRGAEFFNGFQWSTNLDELKFILEHHKTHPNHHLLECPEFQEKFRYDPAKVAANSNFAVQLPTKQKPQPKVKHR